MVTPNWFGSIFPMTNNPKIEPFTTKEKVLHYLKVELQDKKDHDFHYAVHLETSRDRVEKAWRNETMLFPFPSNKLTGGAVVFFRWIGDEHIYGTGIVDEVIPNVKSNGEFPLAGRRDNKIYPYIVRFRHNSIQVNKDGISPQTWLGELGLNRIPIKVAYLKLNSNECKKLSGLFS